MLTPEERRRRRRLRILALERVRGKQASRRVAHVGAKVASRWTIGLINAPFTIWLFSVVALSVGGALFTGVQACRSEAEKATARYEKLELELINRLDRLYTAIRNSNTVSDLKSALAEVQQGYINLDFKGYTLQQVMNEYTEVSKLDLGKSPEVLTVIYRERFKQFGYLMEIETMEFASGPILGNPQLAEAALPKMQEIAWASAAVLNRLKIYRWRIIAHPLCGVYTVAHRLITGEPRQIITENWETPDEFRWHAKANETSPIIPEQLQPTIINPVSPKQ
jgi:hypothetical protein